MRRVHLYQRSHRCWCNSLWSDQRASICPKKLDTRTSKTEKWRKRSILLGQTFPSDMFNYTTKINQLLKKYTNRYVMYVYNVWFLICFFAKFSYLPFCHFASCSLMSAVLFVFIWTTSPLPERKQMKYEILLSWRAQIFQNIPQFK